MKLTKVEKSSVSSVPSGAHRLVQDEIATDGYSQEQKWLVLNGCRSLILDVAETF